MASLKDIRTRIQSVKKTQKTTSAMKMVSAAKLRRAQDAITKASPYANLMKSMVSRLSSRFTEEDHPLFAKSTGKKTAVILITSDRGLCGAFNTHLCKNVVQELQENGVEVAEITVIGRKGRDFFKRQAHHLTKIYTEIPEVDQSSTVKEIVQNHITKFENKELDQVYIAHNHFVSVLTQEPIVEKLLPITPPEVAQEPDDREVIFEPSATAILDSLLRSFVENQVQVGWLDSNAGEHASRMNAMESATKNAQEMIDNLQLSYNRMRQAKITTELIEIISGAESL